MKILYLSIKNFKSIEFLQIKDIDNAMIIVGRNSVGKTVILDAIRLVTGDYEYKESDFNSVGSNIEISMEIFYDEEDLKILNQSGIVSRYRNYDNWIKDFKMRLPSFIDNKLCFTFVLNKDGRKRFDDGFKKNNHFIEKILPKIDFISHYRNIESIQNRYFISEHSINNLIDRKCIFDKSKECMNCFQCISVINRKTPEKLSVQETAMLMQYKLMKSGVDDFVARLNNNFRKNGGMLKEAEYGVKFDINNAFKQEIYLKNDKDGIKLEDLSDGMKSIFALSLLETYSQDTSKIPSIIMIEDPEIFLHPHLQKTASEILYRLSKKNQVIFSTHSPNLIFNFNSKQIKQVVLDESGNTIVRDHTDIDVILNDLGYSANDLMNVNFVFIVEGKQDRSRLPLLLKKYYGEAYDSNGQLKRAAIISTNSCTNIKTYANLKYINKLYIKDQFLMIRDGDGKDASLLKKQLCGYYDQRYNEDPGNLPRVRPENVLILPYYSFENYFLDPQVMEKIGVVKSVDKFYDILWEKYNEYLYKLSSVKNMKDKTGITLNSRQDIIDNMENIRKYVRGHNLFDIFYGRYKGEKEKEILQQYIDAAPKENFKDILEPIEKFVFFESKKTK